HRTMKRLSLDEYIRLTPYANVQTKLLSGQDPGYDFLSGECTSATLETAKRNLDKYFALVGLTERFDETLALAKLLLGWKVQQYGSLNVTKQRPAKDDVPAEIRQVIAERYSYDMELYSYAAARFETAVARHRDELAAALISIRRAKEQSATKGLYFRTA